MNFMTAMAFVDTNVLLYAASQADADREKRAIARQVLTEPEIRFSAQVLQEFYVAAVTKQRLEMTHEEALAVLHSLSGFPVWPITSELVFEAITSKQRYQISYWDAAILVAAKQLGCGIVYSEDLNDGQEYDGVRVVNPFAAQSPLAEG
jgi:predicted nucleic acid-binding protein